jgi:CHAT domain-containing protein
MKRFYGNVLGRRAGLERPMPKAEALREAKAWLRGLRRPEVLALIEELTGEVDRGKGTKARQPAELAAGDDNDRPFEAPQFWAAFVLAGDPD